MGVPASNTRSRTAPAEMSAVASGSTYTGSFFSAAATSAGVAAAATGAAARAASNSPIRIEPSQCRADGRLPLAGRLVLIGILLDRDRAAVRLPLSRDSTTTVEYARVGERNRQVAVAPAGAAAAAREAVVQGLAQREPGHQVGRRPPEVAAEPGLEVGRGVVERHPAQAGPDRGGPDGGSQPTSLTDGPWRVSKKQGGRRLGGSRPSNSARAAVKANRPDSRAPLTEARSEGERARSKSSSARFSCSYARVYWLTACGLSVWSASRSTEKLRRSATSASRSSLATALASANWAPLRMVRCCERFSSVRASITPTATTPATASRTVRTVPPSVSSWPGGGWAGGAVAGGVPAASSTRAM